ncbi:MAG: DMT family transporter, partial [Sphingobacteriia bacterium]
MQALRNNHIIQGVLLAIAATLLWSGNFIISRAVSNDIGPISLAFYRWLTATIIIAPFAWKKINKEKSVVLANKRYLFFVSLTGIALFNTFVYIAGHTTSAINMALIGTTSSPIFATILAIIFLKEAVGKFRIIGMLICISGILLLISNGSWEKLAAFHFSKGDLWILAGAFAFAIYNVLIRKKPGGISADFFLMVIFGMGTAMLFPFYIGELIVSPAPNWNPTLIGSILYLGAGTSAIAFLCWNLAIQKLGAGRTVLFGNLIPVFSIIEAVLILGEKMSIAHLVSGTIVILGLTIA